MILPWLGWRVPHSAIRPAYASGCIWAVGAGLQRLQLAVDKFGFRVRGEAPMGLWVCCVVVTRANKG